MDAIPSPRELRAAAAVAQSLAYVAGLAGVVAGALLYRDGQTAFAVVAWALTFAAGAILMIAAFLTRAVAAVLARLSRVEQDLSVLTRREAAERPAPRERDPWGHQPPY